MPVPATPQNFRLVSATVRDERHAVLTVACDPVAGATEYRWYHEYGNAYTPSLRAIAVTKEPLLTVGESAPFVVAPGVPYTMAVEAANADGVSVANAQQFDVPRWISQSGPSVGKPFAVIGVQEVADSFQFAYPLTGPKGTHDVQFIFDSGAFEMLLTEADATAMGLPNLGPLQVSGVGGASTAYQSVVSFVLGGRAYRNVPCVVDTTFMQNLFGARFWIENRIAALVDPVSATISFFDAGK